MLPRLRKSNSLTPCALANGLSLTELADRIYGTIICGQRGLFYTGIAALDNAGPGDISFLGNDKYISQFLTTKAGAVIISTGYDFGNHPAALVAVANPSLAFAEIVRHFAVAPKPFQPGIHPASCIDPTAVLDPSKVRVHAGAVVMAGAIIGDGTEIGSNTVIQEEVQIGKNCYIGANVSIRERSRLGDRVAIQPGVVIGSDGYGYEFSDGCHVKIEQVGIVEIHNDVEIGANTTIDRARFGKTVIGEGTKIDNLCQIAHNVIIGKHCLIVAQSGLAGSCRIGDYVTIAAQSGVAGHVVIGDKAILSSRCGATTSLKGDMIYAGKPALPFREEYKLQAHVRRLPKLIARVKALEDASKEKPSSDC